MHPHKEAAATVNYLIPSRTISGSPEEAVAEIDDLVETLLAVRQAVEERASGPVRADRGGWPARVRLLLPKHHAGLSANR